MTEKSATLNLPPDIDRLVRERMATGEYESEGELLRHAFAALDEQEDDLAAVRQAIEEFRAGDPGTPLEQAFAEIRDHA